MKRAIEHACLLICPLCNAPLHNGPEHLKQYHCVNNHCFDVAKQGYLNLLPVQQKRSKAPGDDKHMVLSRKHFLTAGYYQPLAQAIVDQLATHVNDTAPITLLDAGCGEGYYSDFLLNDDAFTDLNIYGIDISKPAILEASKRNKAITWLVASLKNIPIADNSLDAIISVFSPIQTQPFQNKLKKNGVLLTVSPGAQHLQALKTLLYDNVEGFEEQKIVTQLENDWKLLHTEKINFDFELDNAEMIQSLLAMTPHTWRISPQRKARLQQVNDLSCEADFMLTLWQKKTYE